MQDLTPIIPMALRRHGPPASPLGPRLPRALRLGVPPSLAHRKNGAVFADIREIHHIDKTAGRIDGDGVGKYHRRSGPCRVQYQIAGCAIECRCHGFSRHQFIRLRPVANVFSARHSPTLYTYRDPDGLWKPRLHRQNRHVPRQAN